MTEDNVFSLLPFAGDLGATVIIFVLVWYANRQAQRQHKRSIERDRQLLEALKACGATLEICVKKLNETDG